MTARSYTDEQKTEALDLYVEHGACETARRTGIPQNTVSTWARKAGLRCNAPEKRQVQAEALAASQAIKREQLRVDMLDQCARILERMSEPEVDFRGQHARRVELDEVAPQSLRHLVWSFGTLLDKYRLEMGEATDRTEHHAVPERTPEHEAEMGKVIDLLTDRRAS